MAKETAQGTPIIPRNSDIHQRVLPPSIVTILDFGPQHHARVAEALEAKNGHKKEAVSGPFTLTRGEQFELVDGLLRRERRGQFVEIEDIQRRIGQELRTSGRAVPNRGEARRSLGEKLSHFDGHEQEFTDQNVGDGAKILDFARPAIPTLQALFTPPVPKENRQPQSTPAFSGLKQPGRSPDAGGPIQPHGMQRSVHRGVR